MRQFHEQSWSARFGRMGDEAEQKFESIHTNWARFGLNRPPVNLTEVPPFIRYMPDYLMHDRLVECMGVGKDQLLKLKVDKLHWLNEWDGHLPVWLFVWDSHNKRFTSVTVGWLSDVAALAPIKQFHEGKDYYEIPLDTLAVVWHAD